MQLFFPQLARLEGFRDNGSRECAPDDRLRGYPVRVKKTRQKKEF
jgi:hypothetical protein